MARYVWINPDRLPSPHTERPVEGIDLTVELSPYDVPTGIVGEYKQPEGYFLITLEYMDKEPGKVYSPGHGVRVVIGQHSGKLLSISIPVDHPPLDHTAVISLQTKVLDALARVTGEPKRGYRNRNVAKELVSANFDKLAGELVSAN